MSMCQCGIFNNCNGSCKFCLIKDEKPFTLNEIYYEIEKAIDNIYYISNQKENWTNKYSDGISVLGGEIFYIQDTHYKELMLELVDTIIEKIIKVSPNPRVRFSTVSNGFYDPNNLLFPVMDKFRDTVGIDKVDVNFSYDFKYRFASEKQEEIVRNTINAFHSRYNYCAGIQMILTQDVINKFLYEDWRPVEWIEKTLPGNQLALLYPHPINRGNGFTGSKALENFNFTRSSFLKFIRLLRDEDHRLFEAFLASTQNSSVFKYTMLYDKGTAGDENQDPVLSDGKEVLNTRCNHSVLYQCYSDSDKCMLCDLEAI